MTEDVLCQSKIKLFLIVLTVTLITTVFSFEKSTYDLKSYSKSVFKRLETVMNQKFDSPLVTCVEYDSLSEFINETGAPFFIKGFSNENGIFIQSRSLLGAQFEKTLLHELMHFTLKANVNIPRWFEEGLICHITDELAGSRIAPMEDVESFVPSEAGNNWELTSYSLGCLKKVREILELEEGL